jgi:hypothetical protein
VIYLGDFGRWWLENDCVLAIAVVESVLVGSTVVYITIAFDIAFGGD